MRIFSKKSAKVKTREEIAKDLVELLTESFSLEKAQGIARVEDVKYNFRMSVLSLKRGWRYIQPFCVEAKMYFRAGVAGVRTLIGASLRSYFRSLLSNRNDRKHFLSDEKLDRYAVKNGWVGYPLSSGGNVEGVGKVWYSDNEQTHKYLNVNDR